MNVLCAGVLLVLVTGSPLPRTMLFPLRPADVLCESALDDAAKLIDGDTNTAWFPGWTVWRYPASIAINLGAVRRVTTIALYNEQGEHAVTVSVGTPFAWRPLPISRLGGYRAWTEIPIGEETRWLRLTVASPTELCELKVFVSGETPSPRARRLPAPAPKSRQAPSIDQLLGVNAFIDDPRATIAAPANFVREYHPWSWDEGDGKDGYAGYPSNANAFQPSAAAGGNAWFFDDYYADLKRRALIVCPALMQAPVWLTGKDGADRRPHATGADPEDPASYVAHADHLFQFAARYGRRKVADGSLKLAPNQPRKSGLDLLTWIENGNEPDKDWLGPACHSSPFALAAQCSAAYDGHRRALGKTVGIKNADPTMRLSVAGLVGSGIDYWRAMKLWSDFQRGGRFPADAINVHHYSNDGSAGQLGKIGISPEADQLRERMARLVAWRDANLPACEVWLTEFGWDTHPQSIQRAPAIGSMSAERVQGAWLVRSVLALAAARVDRAAMYLLRDVNPADATQFSTSGLVTQKGEWKPKTAFYYLATLKQRLAGMQFQREVPTGRTDVRVYAFRDNRNHHALALWCPTSEDKSIADVTVSVRSKRATLIQLRDGALSGAARGVVPIAGQLRLTVTETPQFILWEP